MVWRPSTTSKEVIAHSAKGSHWGKHKYIAIKNGRYIYPSELTNSGPNGWRGKDENDKNLPDATRAIVKAQRDGYKRTLREDIKSGKTKQLTGESLSTDIFAPKNPHESETLKEFADRNAKATKAVRAAQKAGKRRTRHEEEKQNRNGERKEIEAFNNIAREQEKGRNRTAATIKRRPGESAESYYNRQAKIASGGKTYSTKNTKYATERSIRQTSPTAQQLVYEKKASVAASVRKQGMTAQNNDRADTGRYGGMARDNHEGKLPKNKTARKNQAKAKVKTALFKTKYKAKKLTKAAVSKGKSLYDSLVKTKSYRKDTFTGKKYKVDHNAKDAVNIKQLAKKNKKRR